MRSTALRDSRARLAAALLLAVVSMLLALGGPGIEVGRSGANLSDTETVGAGSLVTRAACTATPSSYTAAVTALNPTFYWQFSDATTVADSSGNGNIGAIVTGTPPVTVTLGDPNTGLVPCDDTGLTSPSIPGTSTSGSFVVKPTADQTRNTLTIMAWVRTTWTAGGRILGQGDSASGLSTHSDRMLFLDNAGHVVFGVFSNNKFRYLRSSAAVNDGLPHFLAASLGKAGATLYVDGVRVQLDPTLTKADTYPKNQGYWRVGWDNLSGYSATGQPQPTDFGLNGVIDEAAVFQGTQLSDAQIAGLWAANHW